MDPQTVNVLVSVALTLLTVTALLFISSAVPLLFQASRTLIAYEKLADTLNGEVPATLRELRQIVERVNQLGSVTTQRVTDVGHKVEEVSGSITQVAQKARNRSSVFGAGLMAGVKAYLTGQSDNHQDPGSIRQIAASTGEENVR